MDAIAVKHQITRVRRDTRRRTLTVASVERLTPRMLRIGFTSPDLRDFESAAPDDHVKIFFPPLPGGEDRPAMRDFTPRRFDAARGTLVIDFALHEAGRATDWASSAQIGDRIEVGGPRGSAVVPDDFDWYLLIGDETALPAIGRWVEELRQDVLATVLALIAGAEEAQRFDSRAALTTQWIVRDGRREDAALLLEALAGFTPPAGDGFVWIAAEGPVARAVRAQVLDGMGHPREWTKAAGYWMRGQADAHERIED